MTAEIFVCWNSLFSKNLVTCFIYSQLIVDSDDFTVSSKVKVIICPYARLP